MAKGPMIFNGIVYALVVGYILYINFASFYNRTTRALNDLSNLFSNWIFRLCYLVVVGFFALDVLPYGGFTLAVLLTIAFLNTNMLVNKNKINESFASINEYMTNQEDVEGESNTMQTQDDMMGLYKVAGIDQLDKMAPPATYKPVATDGPVGKIFDNSAEPFVGEQVNENPKDNCGPYAPIYTKPFNPRPFRPDEAALASGAPDQLPVESRYNGPYTDSGVSYDFNMA
jgi:hypothetical protein